MISGQHMALTKRGRFWHYDFEYKGKRFQGSTDQTNRNLAKLVEAKMRSDAALERFGIAAPKAAPIGKDFLEGKFLHHVRKHAKKPRTALFYTEHVARLLKHAPFAELRLNQIDGEVVAGYAPKAAIATINGDLRTLRKALNLAFEWRLIPRPVKVRALPGENNRKFVLTGEMETFYLSLLSYPLKQAAILMLDLGLRVEECVSLRKADTGVEVTVLDGKTVNARRNLPHTNRSNVAVSDLFALFPDSPWLFPGKKDGHLQRKSLDNLHAKVRREHGLPAEFVLYSLRHTFGTRLAESGASPFEIKAAMGHSDIRVSQRYVHPSQASISLAMARKEALDKMLRGESQEISAEKSVSSGQHSVQRSTKETP